MKPGFIDIPGLAAFQNKHNARLRAAGYPVEQADPIEHPAIEGKAIGYLKPFIYNGEIVLFWEGAFAKALAANHRIALCIDHDTKNEYADTRSGLSVVEASDGLLFR